LNVTGTRLRGGHRHPLGKRDHRKHDIVRRRTVDGNLDDLRSETTERGFDHVAARRQVVDLVSAVLVRDDCSRRRQRRSGDRHHDARHHGAGRVPDHADQRSHSLRQRG
jgi:hypothetical protein